MEDSRFKAEYEKLREQAGAVARAELRGLMLKAAATRAEGMDNDNPWIRLRAAQATINASMKIDGVNENKRVLELMSSGSSRPSTTRSGSALSPFPSTGEG